MMKHRNKRKGCLAAMLAVVLAALTGVVPVAASTPTYTIKVKANDDVECVEGSVFHLYKVADLHDDLTTSYTETFKKYNVEGDVKEEDIQPQKISAMKVDKPPRSSEMEALAQKLDEAVSKKAIPENAQEKINNRQLEFSSLGVGVYLIHGDAAQDGNKTIYYQPLLILLPQSVNSGSHVVESQVKSYQLTPALTGTPSPSGTGTPAPSKTPNTTSTPNTPVTTGTPGTTSTPKPATPGNKTTTPKPTKPSTATQPKGKKNVLSRLLGVKTGDTIRAIVYLAIMVVAAVLIIVLIVRKHRSK